MSVVLAYNWWLLALRGVIAIIFGILTLFNPVISLVVLVFFFGGFALIDGIFAIIAGATAPKGARRWGWLIAGGVLGILIGIGTFFLPLATAFGLTLVVAIWAIVIGITQIIAAIELRKEIEGEIWLILGGILSLIFGIFAIINPLSGALAITFVIGIYAIIYGILMLITAFRLRGFRSQKEQTA